MAARHSYPIQGSTLKDDLFAMVTFRVFVTSTNMYKHRFISRGFVGISRISLILKDAQSVFVSLAILKDLIVVYVIIVFY